MVMFRFTNKPIERNPPWICGGFFDFKRSFAGLFYPSMREESLSP
jgi:hypothetical protein